MLKKILLTVMFFLVTLNFSFGADTSKAQKSLSVISSKIEQTKMGNYDVLACLGKIKNTADKQWDDIVIEVQFFDANNELIDSITESKYQMVIPPRDEVAFKVSGKAIKSSNAYSSHKVRILSAKLTKKPCSKKSLFVKILTSVLPFIILFAIGFFFFRKSQSKDSPQSRIIANQEAHLKVAEEQNALFKELIETLRKR